MKHITSRLIKLIFTGLCLVASGNLLAGVSLQYQSRFGQASSQYGDALYYPSGIAVDSSNGDVYVADTGNSLIKRFTADGVFLNQWGLGGSNGLTVDPVDHTVYAVGADHRVYKFDYLGNQLAIIGSRGNAAGQFNTPRDIAINPITRNVFVLDSGNQRVQEFTRDGILVNAWASKPALYQPYGIDIDPTGTYIWIANTGATPFVHKYDLNGNLQIAFGELGSIVPNMRWPRGMAVDATGNVFVAATDMERVHKYDSDGNFLQMFMGPETDIDGPAHPRAVAVNHNTGHIYTAAAYSNRIDHFDASGNFIAHWGYHERDGLYLSNPRGIVADPFNQVLYVADNNSHLIKKFSYDGLFLGQYGNWPLVHRDETAVTFPAAISVDAAGNYWALNEGIIYPDDPTWGDDRFVRRFDSNGNFLSGFAHPDFNAEMGGVTVNKVANEVYVAVSRKNKIIRFDFNGTVLSQWGTLGSAPGQLRSPAGMAINVNDGYILVVDAGNHRIQKFTLDGTFLMQFGSQGTGPGQFNFAYYSSLTLDLYGNIYVADTGNNRVQVFNSSGGYITQHGTYGFTAERFAAPQAVTYDAGKLFVLETSGKEVEIYQTNVSSVDTVWVDDAIPTGGVAVGAWDFINANPTKYAGAVAHQSTLAVGTHQHLFYNTTNRLAVNAGDSLFAYVYLDSANPPSEIMLQWREGTNWNHRAYWGANSINWGTDGTESRRYMGPLPAAGGWIRLEVPASAVGLEGRVLNGMAFTLYDGRATWDYAGKSSPLFDPPPPPPPASALDTVWVDDAIPAGAIASGAWNFINSNPIPFHGGLAHQSTLAAGTHQHMFYSATNRLSVNTGETLFAYVYLDPANSPTEVMLEWREGASWNHRAYWGANRINWGTDGTESRHYMGPLPAAGGWVRLEVPAGAVGLEGRTLNGMAFTLYDGFATWDYAGKY